jgi:hypothetical protein
VTKRGSNAAGAGEALIGPESKLPHLTAALSSVVCRLSSVVCLLVVLCLYFGLRLPMETWDLQNQDAAIDAERPLPAEAS